jgi:hypothetical protein
MVETLVPLIQERGKGVDLICRTARAMCKACLFGTRA